MGKTSLICEQCGGQIVLDNTHEFGTCRSCRSHFFIQKDQLIYQVTQNITKHVYGQDGKDAEELINEGYRLIELGNTDAANRKFRQAVDVDPGSWGAWLGYASTGANDKRILSIADAYQSAYSAAQTEDQQIDTFVDMVRYFPNRFLRASFIRSFVAASPRTRAHIFQQVINVLGCDESEMAMLALDLNPTDWNSALALASFRKIRAKWCKFEGFFSRKLPKPAEEVRDLFINAYVLARQESADAAETVLEYIQTLSKDPAYSVLCDDLFSHIKKLQ